ncbi:MAG: MarR family transcriptional regulator, partial [Atopostipes sp.]|nr:MarR family transcriptional regulator [Atopostipes sp.]
RDSMNQKAPEIKAFTVFMKASQSVERLIKQDFLKKEISFNEYAILELLYHRGEQPTQSIVKRVLMGDGSITYVIDKLKEKGFIKRRPGQKDRRKIYAGLTKKGKNYMDQRVVEQEAIIHKIFDDLNDEEVEIAIDLLKRIGIHADNLLK